MIRSREAFSRLSGRRFHESLRNFAEEQEIDSFNITTMGGDRQKVSSSVTHVMHVVLSQLLKY